MLLDGATIPYIDAVFTITPLPYLSPMSLSRKVSLSIRTPTPKKHFHHRANTQNPKMRYASKAGRQANSLLFHHDRQLLALAPPHAVEVHAQHAPPVGLLVDLMRRAPAAADARVVDGDVEAAEAPRRLGDARPHLRRVEHVHLQRQHVDVRVPLPQCRARPGQRVAVDVGERERADPAAGEGEGGVLADAWMGGGGLESWVGWLGLERGDGLGGKSERWSEVPDAAPVMKAVPFRRVEAMVLGSVRDLLS
jgi:hypothetical protein